MLKFPMAFEFEEERIQDLFEANDIKFSKAKMNKLKKLFDEVYYDIQSAMEETLETHLDELIVEEWGE
jgi:diketogulonate reductase-like aldo/keto reductase